MHPLKTTTMAYFIIMHVLTTVYALFALGAGPLLTFLLSSFSSMVLLLLSSTMYIDNVLLSKSARRSHYLIFYFLFILPITLSYYLPVFFSKDIIKVIGYVFPSIAQYLIWLSYNPVYALFIFPQLIISILITIFVYYYLNRIKK